MDFKPDHGLIFGEDFWRDACGEHLFILLLAAVVNRN
jgi:hypothetical protein